MARLAELPWAAFKLSAGFIRRAFLTQPAGSPEANRSLRFDPSQPAVIFGDLSGTIRRTKSTRQHGIRNPFAVSY